MSDLPDPGEPSGPDLLAIIDAFDQSRELVRGVVAMFRSDGFSDAEARALAVNALTGYRYTYEVGDDGEASE